MFLQGWWGISDEPFSIHSCSQMTEHQASTHGAGMDTLPVPLMNAAVHSWQVEGCREDEASLLFKVHSYGRRCTRNGLKHKAFQIQDKFCSTWSNAGIRPQRGYGVSILGGIEN